MARPTFKLILGKKRPRIIYEKDSGDRFTNLTHSIISQANEGDKRLIKTKNQVRRPRLPSTMVAAGAGRSRIHHRQLEVPPGRKERVVEKINQLEARKREDVLTSGATELLRSLKVELGKIESQEKSAR